MAYAIDMEKITAAVGPVTPEDADAVVKHALSIRVGSTVELKSGGPKMVVNTYNLETLKTQCTWIHSGGHQTWGEFHVMALKVVE